MHTNTSFILCLLFIISNFSAAGLETIAAYTDYGWENQNLPAYPANPPLEADETLQPADGITILNNRIITQVIRSNEFSYLIAWSVHGGNRFILNQQKERVFGLAALPEEDRLIVRGKKSLLILDGTDFSTMDVIPFDTVSGWRDITAIPPRFFEISKNRNAVNVYSLENYRFLYSLPVEPGKLQRIFPLNRQQLLVWSSYWTPPHPRVLDLENGLLKESLILNLHYHALFKTTVIAGKKLYTLGGGKNPFTGELLRVGNSLIPLTAGTQREKSGIGYRYAPFEQKIEGELSVQPAHDIPSGNYHLLLPVKSTYVQEITEESYTGSITTDPFGNRYLQTALPALRREEKKSFLLYSARITRYKTAFDIPASAGTVTCPSGYNRYLTDDHYLLLSDPLVVKTHQQIMNDTKSVADKIIAAHAFSMSIGRLWDGKIEKVPDIIRYMHGGCNEHTRAIVALLRLSDIPARYAWNYFSAGYEEKTFTMNHAIAEAYLNGTGWVPLEGLGRTYGAINPYIIFELGAPDCRKYQPGLQKGALTLRRLNGKRIWTLSAPDADG